MKSFKSSITCLKRMLCASKVDTIPHTLATMYVQAAAPISMDAMTTKRSPVVRGITSPYPTVDNVANAQYTDIRYFW